MILECRYEPTHEHEFPDDWQFGGPDETDPRADPRWVPFTYLYYDEGLHLLHLTSAPICDDQALDEFTLVSGWFPDHPPVYLARRRMATGEKEHVLPYSYNAATDTVKDLIPVAAAHPGEAGHF